MSDVTTGEATSEPGSIATLTQRNRPLPPLSEVLANRRWVRRTTPFPHVVAGNVFTADFYAQLDAEFHRIDSTDAGMRERNMGAYDASGSDIKPYRNGPLRVFASREWHDMLNGLFGVTGTGDVSLSLHHHEPGAASGWAHNDLNPGWFADPPAATDQVRLSYEGGVDYFTGNRPDGVGARETIRAVSLLFYLGNPEWQPGDGGETGLYETISSPRPAAAVPPINNSLVVFECSPHSWHGFVSNLVKPRNSIVMWTHREKSDVERRWGVNSIVGW